MSRNPPTYCRQPSGNLRRISAWNAFKKSHFVSSFMLGLSYLICMAFPGIAASIFHVILDQPNIPRAFDATLIVLTKVSWIVEVCIYVLVDADVRQHLHRKRRVHQIHIENSQRHQTNANEVGRLQTMTSRMWGEGIYSLVYCTRCRKTNVSGCLCLN